MVDSYGLKNNIIPFYKQKNKFIEKAKGCYLFDNEGNKYLDCESGDWAVNLGHCREEISAIIKGQVDTIIHDGLQFRNSKSEELSIRLLNKFAMNNGSSVFLNSGSEAVNLGITIAKNITKRKKILKMDCSYLSAFGFGQISDENENLINVVFNDIASISKINFNDIAVFVFEAGNSGGLIKFPTNEFVKSVAQKTKESGGLLMANEVTVGFGRTGKWFGVQHYEYKPDIISFGKALGNGYPVSGVSVSQKVTGLLGNNYFRYAQSHQNDPLGCAVGLEVMRIIENAGLIQQSFEKGQYLIGQLKKLHKEFPEKIKEVRGRGLMAALEFEQSVNLEKLSDKLLDRGYIIGYKKNVIRFMPPLTIEKMEIDKLIECIDYILRIT